MTPAERRALLGDAAIAHVRDVARRAAAEYPPPPEVLDRLRPILTNPAKRRRQRPAARTTGTRAA
ncbi:hypothetical protein [Streptomyces chumphonensis]|uniref:hypothetical protein n=1 Tax=Streptomyces chumphonensis TaxID=1214925 RepID=UPI003D714164